MIDKVIGLAHADRFETGLAVDEQRSLCERNAETTVRLVSEVVLKTRRTTHQDMGLDCVLPCSAQSFILSFSLI